MTCSQHFFALFAREYMSMVTSLPYNICNNPSSYTPKQKSPLSLMFLWAEEEPCPVERVWQELNLLGALEREMDCT